MLKYQTHFSRFLFIRFILFFFSCLVNLFSTIFISICAAFSYNVFIRTISLYTIKTPRYYIQVTPERSPACLFCFLIQQILHTL